MPKYPEGLAAALPSMAHVPIETAVSTVVAHAGIHHWGVLTYQFQFQCQ